MFETRSVDILYFARAVGISTVVLNHSVHIDFHGGLNLLLLLSGISFATLAFGDNRRPIFQTAYDFLRPLLLGSLFLCGLWFVVKQRIEPAEILMVSNWITVDRASLFPIWYSQVLFQMMLVLALILAVDRVRTAVSDRSTTASLVFLGLVVAVAAISKLIFDSSSLEDQLPQLHAWNFVLGWVLWAVCIAKPASVADRLALTALAVGLIVLMFPVLQMQDWKPRILIFGLPLLVLIWKRQILLPGPIAHIALLISQATLVIFFLHYPFIRLGNAVVLAASGSVPAALSQFGLGSIPIWSQFCIWLFALAGPVIVWAAVTALRRTLSDGHGADLSARRIWGRIPYARLNRADVSGR